VNSANATAVALIVALVAALTVVLWRGFPDDPCVRPAGAHQDKELCHR
jgi:hypothetical protein